jgi:hypothetical protein
LLNKPDPRPLEAAGCDVPDGALVEAPRPENKLGVVPEDVVAVLPNKGLNAGTLEAGAALVDAALLPKLANKFDMVVVMLLLRWPGCVDLFPDNRKQKTRARSGESSERTDSSLHARLLVRYEEEESRQME